MEEAVVPDEQKGAARRKVLRYDAKNKGNLDEIDSQRLDESDEQSDYSRMMDDSYQQTMLVFENDDFDLRERVGAYQNFIEESKELAVNRKSQSTRRCMISARRQTCRSRRCPIPGCRRRQRFLRKGRIRGRTGCRAGLYERHGTGNRGAGSQKENKDCDR